MDWIAFTLAAVSALATAPGDPPPADDLAQTMVAVHNRERALVGVSPLAWDTGLAAQAAAYLPRLIEIGRLEHSTRDARGGAGENLAMGSQGYFSAGALAERWVAEKPNFVNGVFPAVSRTGDWRAVGHYSAMIWRGTTRLGCAAAAGGGNFYLVCRYAPAGNVVGQRVY